MKGNPNTEAALSLPRHPYREEIRQAGGPDSYRVEVCDLRETPKPQGKLTQTLKKQKKMKDSFNKRNYSK